MALVANASMNINENQQGITVLEKLRMQRESGRFCDVVLHVKDVQFQAHRNVLAACSPYFDSVFRMHKIMTEHIVISCSDSEVFHSLLNYLYTGNIVIDKQNINEILRLANQFLIGKLKTHCADYLEKHLDVTNCLHVRDLGWKYNLPSITRASLLFIQTHIHEILDQQEILEYPLQKVEEVLSNRNWVISTEPLLKFLAKWVKHNVSDRQTDYRMLLTLVKWQTIEQRRLEDYLSSEDLFETAPQCLYFILESIELSGIQLENYHNMYLEMKKTYESTANNIDSDKLIEIAVNSVIDEYVYSPELPDEEEEMVAPVLAAPYEKVKEDEDEVRKEQERKKKANGVTLQRHTGQCKENNVVRTRVAYPPRGHALAQLKQRLANLRQRAIATANKANYKGKIIRHRRYISDDGLKNGTRIGCRPSGKVSKPPLVEVVQNNGKEVATDEDDGGLDDENEEFSKNYDSESDEDYSESGDCNASMRWKEGVQCPHCSFVGHSSVRLEQHVSRAHAQDITYRCNICNYTCKWNREYYSHMKGHFTGPPFRCDSCDYTCDRIQLILSHRMKHTDEKPFKCSECNFSCRTKTNLMAHMRTHTGEKPYKCDHCGRCFTMKASLDQHLATHSDDRPFLCDTCGFTTKYQSHLLSHKRIHSGDVFPCQFPSCNYSSPRRSQLAAHMRTHTAVRSHICSTCGRGFVEKSHLVRHERIHLNDKPFKCDQCEYSSSRRDKLKEHFQKHHSEFATAKVPYKPRRPRRQTFDPACYPGLQVSEPDNQVYHSQHSQHSVQTPPVYSFPDHQMSLHPDAMRHDSHDTTYHQNNHHPSVPSLQLPHISMVHPSQNAHQPQHTHHHPSLPPPPHIERLISGASPATHVDHRMVGGQHHGHPSEMDPKSVSGHPVHQQETEQSRNLQVGHDARSGAVNHGSMPSHPSHVSSDQRNLTGHPVSSSSLVIPHSTGNNAPNANQVSDLNNLGIFIPLF